MMELVTGGSGSGKSARAEERICALHRALCKEKNIRIPLYYIADMIPRGRETEKRIEKHRRQRAGRGFTTLEWYFDLPGKLAGEAGECPADLSGACVLLECVSNLTANEMYECGGAGADTVNRIVKGVRMLRDRCAHLVVVTNDVFRESVPDSEEMTEYKKTLGAANRKLGLMADRVTEVVSGRTVCVKDTLERRPEPDETAEDTQERKERTGRNMILVTGGGCQGKLEFAKEKYGFAEWTDGENCPLDDIRSCRVMDHFHLFIRRWLQAGKTPEELTGLLMNRVREMESASPDRMIFISDEIGCGLVPMDAFEREYRDVSGRICTALAEQADVVYRVVCGIGQRLK